MSKKLHFKSWLLMLCMLLGVGNVWAQKITDYTELVSGQAYYIGATVQSTDYYLGLASTSVGNGIQGQKKTSKDDATLFVFEGSGDTWTIQISGTENYMALASSKNNGRVNVVDAASDWTLSNVSSLIQFSNNGYLLQANNSTSLNFGSYKSGQINVWVEAVAASDQSTAPTISGEASFLTSTTVTITAAEGATIYYTLNGTDPTTSSTQYADPFTLTETTTVKAIAVESGKDASNVASKEFTKQAVKANLAALVTDNETGFVQLTDALVTYVTGNHAYIQDASAGMYLYGCAGDLAVGDMITGIMNVTAYTVYNKLPEVTAFTLVDGYTKTSGNTVTAEEITIADLIDNYNNYLSRYVLIKGATVTSAFSSKNSTIEQAGSNIIMRDQNSSATLTTTVDDVVDVYCHPAIYNTTKQLAVWDQSQIVVNTVELLDNVITVTGNGVEGTEFSMQPGDELTLVGNATNNGAVTFTLDTENSTLTVDDDFYFEAENGYLMVYNEYAGTIVIKANTEADDEYKAAEVTITINVSGQKTTPTIVVADANVPYGSTFTVDDSVIEGGDITVTSSNTNVATVSDLVITPIAVGTTTITVRTAENEFYNAGEETFTLTVTGPAGKTEAPSAASEATFDFDGNAWELPTSTTSTAGDYTDGTYTISLAGSGYYCLNGSALLLGKTNATLTFPAFDKAVTQIDVVGTSGASAKVKQNIYVGDVAVSTETTGAKDVTNEYVIDESYQAAGNIYVLKVTSNHNTQISSIVVHFAGGGGSATESVTLNAYGYKTFASEYPLDFSGDNDFTAWELTNIDSEGNITFNEIKDVIKGGQGVLLKGEAGSEISISMADGDVELTDNLFEATLAPTYVADKEYWGLSGNSMMKINEGIVPVGKAILNDSWVNISSSVKTFTFVFNSTDGIQTVEKVSAEEAAKIFDLSGRRLTEMRRGVNIVNGKKIMVK